MSAHSLTLVEERRELKSKMEAAKTRNQNLAAEHVYNMNNKEVKRSCRRRKRKRIDDIAREADEAAEKRDVKKVYDTTSLLSGEKKFSEYISQRKELSGPDQNR